MNYNEAKALIERGKQVLGRITKRVEEAIQALSDTGCTSAEKRAIELAIAASATSVGMQKIGTLAGQWDVHLDVSYSRDKTGVAFFDKGRRVFVADVSTASPEKAKELVSKWREEYGTSLSEWMNKHQHSSPNPPTSPPGSIPSLCEDGDLYVPADEPHLQMTLLMYVELWDGRRWLYCPNEELHANARIVAETLLAGDYGFHPETLFVDDLERIREEINHAYAPGGPGAEVHLVATLQSKMYGLEKQQQVYSGQAVDARAQAAIDAAMEGKMLYPSHVKNHEQPKTMVSTVNSERVQPTPECAWVFDGRYSSGVSKPKSVKAERVARTTSGTYGERLHVEGPTSRPDYYHRLLMEGIEIVNTFIRKRFDRNTLVAKVPSSPGSDGGDCLFTILPDDGIEFVISEGDLRGRERKHLDIAVHDFLAGRLEGDE